MHVVIVGGGNTGSYLARMLIEATIPSASSKSGLPSSKNYAKNCRLKSSWQVTGRRHPYWNRPTFAKRMSWPP